MGSVYRETYTKPLPATAEIVTVKGKKFARVKPSKGKAKLLPITTGKNGEARIVYESPVYVAKYRDGSNHICKVTTGCRDEDAARSILGKLERRAELVRSQVISPAEASTADHQGTLIADHFEVYHQHRTAKGLNAVRIANTKARLKRLADECRFTRLSELTADALTKWLAIQHTNKMSAGNRNEYRQELVGFANWCVQTHRLSVNPFANVLKADAKTDRRRQRRAMTEAELVKLLEVARWRPLAEFGRETAEVDDENTEATDKIVKRSNWTKAALTLDGLYDAVERARKTLAKNPELIADLERRGRERALIYKTLVLTGLRKGELASITVGQLELDGPMPFIVLEAADEKNRQGSTIPLRSDLASDLTVWLSDVPIPSTLRLSKNHGKIDPKRPLFTVPAGLVRILNRDLSAAGINKADERGRTIDVHALRTSFGTLLSKGGVAPRTAQAAMRHSTIDLTMNTYTDPKLLDVQGALNSLPSLDLNPRQTTERQSMRATGTDDMLSSQLVPMLVPDSGKSRQIVSFVAQASENTNVSNPMRSGTENPKKSSEKALSTEFVNKAFRVERKGVEPSTSALVLMLVFALRAPGCFWGL